MDCPRCGTNFKTKQHLVRHLRINKPCDNIISDISREKYLRETLGVKISNYKCKYCNKKYQRCDYLTSHLKSCKKKKEHDNLDALTQQVKDLQQYINITNNNNCHNTNNTNNNTTNNNGLHIHLERNPFGEEDLSMLTDDFMVKCLSMCSEGYPELLKHIHFNKKYPKNHNLYIPNKKDKLVSFYKGDDIWEFKRLLPMLDKLYLTIDTIMLDFYQDHSDKLGKRHARKFGRFHSNIEVNEKLIARVQDLMHLIIISYREMVEKSK